MLLAVKPFACFCLFCLSVIVFVLAPSEHRNSASLDPNSHHYHHHQLQKITRAPQRSCDGRRIYIHRLPPQFNSQLLQQCGYGITNWLHFCAHISNHGYGKQLDTEELTLEENNEVMGTSPLANGSLSQSTLESKSVNHLTRKTLSASSSIVDPDTTTSRSPLRRRSEWHRTDAYMLEIIFHYRLLQYPCLTDDPDMADAFFLPYYTGLDALKYLYGKQGSRPKTRHGSELSSWIQQDAIAKQAWKRYRGQDHFLIMGRTPWDFGNLGSGGWGTGILDMPEFANMTLLLFEKQPWIQNQHAVPYPTSFHPSSSSSLHAWTDRVRAEERPSLFAFAGSVHNTWLKGGIRDMLVDQCLSSKACKFLDCKKHKCSHNPGPIMRAFLHSQFCLQPRGDTPTRRSLFDAIIAGCIPVFFHNDTAYTQYKWHVAQEPRTWSVYIDEEEIKKGRLVEETLLKYPKASIVQMREVLIGVIPKVVYAGMSKQGGEADAFDVSVREVLKLVSKKKRNHASVS